MPVRRPPGMTRSLDPSKPTRGVRATTTAEGRVCRTAMAAALMLDRTHGVSEKPSWNKGTAATGIVGMIKEGDRDRLSVVTCRCPTCGRPESFAQTV